MRVILILLFLVSACGKVNFKPSDENFLGGRILPLGGFAHNRSFLISSAYASVVCTEDTFARLHKVEADGSLNPAPVASTQVEENRYIFSIDELPLDIHSDTVFYQVAISGCDEVLYRPVTGVNSEQDVSYASTMVGMSSQSSLSKPLSDIDKVIVEDLIKKIQGASLANVYTNLNTNPSLSNKFQEIFQDPPAKLGESHPSVSLVSFPTLIGEGLSSSYKISSIHFDPAYPRAQEWLLDGVKVSDAAEWIFSPSADAAGTYIITSIVGRDDSSGNVDRSKPFYTYSHAVTVLNTLPALAPDFTLVSQFSNSGTFTVKVATGSAQEYCETFQSFMLTDTSSKPLPSNPAFNRSCLTDMEQTETVSLSAGEGARTLSLWVKDRNGVVSNSAKTQTIYVDTTAPVVSLSSPSGQLKGGSSVSVSFSASDALAGLQSIKLQYASDGATFSDLATLAVTDTSYNWTLPSHNTTSATLRLIVFDKAGNSETVTGSAFTIDSLAPSAPSVSLASSSPTKDLAISMSLATCADIPMVLVSTTASAPALSSGDWQACSTASGGLSKTLTAGDGSRSLYIWGRDLAGNISSATHLSVVIDQTAPAAPSIVFASNAASAEMKTEVSTTLSVSSCTDTSKILITTSSSAPAEGDSGWQNCSTTSGAIAFTLSPAVEATHALKAWAKDAVGNISASASNLSFLYDVTAPASTLISVNSGQSSTGNNNLLIDLTATSTREDITAFCLKYNDTTAPQANDSCWVTLSSIGHSVSSSFNLASYPFQIGTILGVYEIRVWLKDDLDNISLVSDTESVDKYSIGYEPDPPPTISNAIASSSDTPSNPLTSADTAVTLSADVYIRWNITDDKTLPGGSISLAYTTNESTYTSIVSGLNNGANGDCTVDAESTGCYKWTAASPLSSYYKIKVSVTDSGVSSVFSLTNPLNTGNVNFLSGNTSLGIGGSANSAILLGEGESNFNDASDNGALVVTKTGITFYKYKGKGLTYISPEDGLLKVLIPHTGTTSGNGVAASSATLKSLTRVTMDYDGNILIWDDVRVRKITLSTNPWRIDTVMGGGSDTSDGAIATNASIGTASTNSLFTVTPTGRIYYQKGKQVWYFDPTDNKVKLRYSLGGIGTYNMAGAAANYNNDTCPMSITALAFDKTTSAITKIIRKGQLNTLPECGNLAVGTSGGDYNTSFDVTTGQAQAPHPASMSWSSVTFTGMDGKIYVLTHGRAYLQRYNPVTNAYEAVVGNGAIGRCVDGTPALSCPVTVMSAFVNEFGKIYFYDMGVIRTVDQFGNVQTLAGQPRNYGIGSNPLSARYSKIAFFTVANNEVYIKNKLENQLVKFSLTGGNLEHVAGNGTAGAPAHDADAITSRIPECSWGMPCSFMVDSANNRLYHYAGTDKLAYINLATGKWFIENYVAQASARISYLGINNNSLLAYLPSHAGTTDKVTLKSIDHMALSSTHLYGQNAYLSGMSTFFCSGSVGTDCTLAHTQGETVQTQYKYDSTLASWLVAYKGNKAVHAIPEAGGTVTEFEPVTNNMESFDFFRDGANQTIFYCGTNGSLYKRNVVTDAETLLPLPSTSLKCSGQALHYHPGRDSIIFTYTQNGLYGIAEYKNP